MRRCAETLLAATLGLLAALPAQADGVARLDERAALRESLAAVGRPLPELTLLDRRQRPVRLADYRGKPLLVSFIYTGCFTVCPTQTRALQQAVQGLERMLGPGRFKVVSIGFNQPFDSPQALRAFAAQHRIEHPDWEFLSPPREQVERLTQAFGFSYVETPAGFEHIVGVTVVDAQGRIHSQVYAERLTAEALGGPLRELVLAAPPAGALPSLDQLVDRVRILCTVYDPDTGAYRYDWKLLLELIGGLAFFGSIGVYLWRERLSQRAARADAL
jgi:protein SCO1/2